MHKDLIKVADNPNLARDSKTNAILDLDTASYENYIIKKQLKQQQFEKISHLEERINMFESDVKDIKQLLQQLLER